MSGSQIGRRNGRRKPMAEINVVPYIDVTLVLLIIFMITTPMLQTGVDVDLPQTQSKTVESDGEGDNPPIIISIKAEGQYYIKSDNQTDVPILPEDINDRVAEILSNKPRTQVLINADKGVNYGTVVTVMAALKNAGVPTVGLMTKPEEQ
ncbi:MAG: protein TolR [Methylococcales bacterium]|nr:MAG: protein TolR [Methylococcales bacterium]